MKEFGRPRARLLAGIALIAVGLPFSTISIICLVFGDDLQVVASSCGPFVIWLLVLGSGIAFVIGSFRLRH